MLWPLSSVECRTTQNCCYDETTHNKYYSWSWFKLRERGPTHYSTEDLALFMNFSGSTVYTASDSDVAAQIAETVCKNNDFSFVGLIEVSERVGEKPIAEGI